MTKEEAMKYLQQLYPNGGHCWLDEQRIEAISMAVKALQEESVSEDLEKAIDTYLATYFGGEKEKQDWLFLKKMAIHFANWQKQQTVNKACKWLDENIEKYISAEGEWNIDWNFINDFKKYMEG